MAFIFSREKTLLGQRKTQRHMVFMLLAVVLVTGFILWRGFSKSSSPSGPYANPPLGAKSVDIDFGAFEDKIFGTLGAPPPPISLPQNTGRTNPFIPF